MQKKECRDMNRIIDSLCDRCDSFSSLIFDKIAYATGVSGSIEKEVTIIGAKRVIILKCESGAETRRLNCLTIYNANYDSFKPIQFNYTDHIVAIREDFFDAVEAPAIMLGGFSNVHDKLICDLIISIKKSSTPEFLLSAIANLVAVEYRELSEKTKFQSVVEAVEANYLDDDFSLDTLSRKVFMSRRKLQYILSSENVFFLDLVNSYRISHLKALLQQNPSFSLTRLVSDSGFKNTAAANRVIKKHLNISLKELKEIVLSSKKKGDNTHVNFNHTHLV